MGAKELARIERWNLVLAAVFVVLAAVLGDSRFLLGAVCGSVLCCANFAGMRRLMAASMRTGGSKRMTLQLLLIGKMGILIALVFVAMRFLPLSPVALAIGLSIFLISIAIESVRFAAGQKTPNGQEDGRA